jgi:hypothetical protein
MLAYVAILLQRLSLYNPGTGWAATDPAFTHKSTRFPFHALRDGVTLVGSSTSNKTRVQKTSHHRLCILN